MSSYRKFENRKFENKNLKIKKMKALQACRYKRTHKASLSVEAAMCFSLFIIAMAVLIMPFDMMNTNRKIRGIAEAVCKDSCQYAYTYYRFTGNTREENENGISYKVDPDVWYIIRNTNGVTGFVGVGSDPIPMEDDEVKNIFNIIGMDTSKETIKLDFAEGDFVKILKGSFIDQEGQVAEIDYEHGRVKVMVDIFGRMTPVEIEVDGVLKV